MNKKTTLDDSADIYVKREKKSERQKLKDMTAREKLSYFNTYYTKKVIVGLIALGIIFSFFYQVLSPKPEEILSIAVINDSFDKDKFSSFQDDLNQYFNVDNEKSIIRIDPSYYIMDNDVLGSNSSSIQKLLAYISANDLDIVIADPNEFKELMVQGYFLNLKDILPDDLYKLISPDLYKGAALVDPSDASNLNYGDEADYGIYLDDNEIYKNSGTSIPSSIIGILCNTPHLENTIKFIEYLYK